MQIVSGLAGDLSTEGRSYRASESALDTPMGAWLQPCMLGCRRASRPGCGLHVPGAPRTHSTCIRGIAAPLFRSGIFLNSPIPRILQ